MRLPLLCVLPGLAWSAADHLPDMRWLFERAQRLDRRSDISYVDRVRAWAMIPLCYPADEPGTENDEVWRMVARGALSALDASAAGYPPPGPMQRPALAARDAVGEALGVQLLRNAAGEIVVHSVLRPGAGLTPGDRLQACAGFALPSLPDAADRIAAGGSPLRLNLDDGREVDVVPGSAEAAPQIAALAWHGELQPWQNALRWSLPRIDGAWLISGSCDPGLSARFADGGACSTISAIADAPSVLTIARYALGGSSFALRAVPLRGTWRDLRFDAAAPTHRTILGIRAGQAVVIASRGAPHRLSVVGPDGRPWYDDPPGDAHRVIRHGAPGQVGDGAVACNGMIAISVRPLATPSLIHLRILTASGACAP